MANLVDNFFDTLDDKLESIGDKDFPTIHIGIWGELVIGIILGWVAMLFLICLIFDENVSEIFSSREAIFITFPMGAIVGGGFVLAKKAISKNNQKKSPDEIETAKNQDKYKKLADLKALLDNGAISQEEYDSEKSKLLNS